MDFPGETKVNYKTTFKKIIIRALLADQQAILVSVLKDFLDQTTKLHVCSSCLEPLID